jgi:hypothetical protein
MHDAVLGIIKVSELPSAHFREMFRLPWNFLSAPWSNTSRFYEWPVEMRGKLHKREKGLLRLHE